jgi:hypothetical protein
MLVGTLFKKFGLFLNTVVHSARLIKITHLVCRFVYCMILILPAVKFGFGIAR